MQGRVARLSLAVLFLTLSGAAGADEEIRCEHAKLNTQDATPVDPGAWEFDLGCATAWSRHAFGNSWGRRGRPRLREQELGMGLTYGLAPDLNIGLGLGYANIYDRAEDHFRSRG